MKHAYIVAFTAFLLGCGTGAIFTQLQQQKPVVMDHSMPSMMMDMTARMEGKTGPELEKVFLEDMIVHHQGAIDMAKVLAQGTGRVELQKMAQDIITVQSKEIEMMRGWLAAWFK